MMNQNAASLSNQGSDNTRFLSSTFHSHMPTLRARFDRYNRILKSGSADEKMGLIQELRDYIFAEEEKILFPNGGAPEGIMWQTPVDESRYGVEIHLMLKLCADFEYSGEYRLKMREIANNIAVAMAADKDMQFAQHNWNGMDLAQKKTVLRKAQKTHAQVQQLDGIQTGQNISVVFNNEARALPDGQHNPQFGYASHSDSLHSIFNSKALGWMFGTPDSVINYNVHPDNSFMRGGFATALSAMHHEQQHAFQSALALAYFEKRIDPASPYYKDAELLYRLRMHDCYVPPSIYSVYRKQALERDTFDFQHLMETHLRRPFPGSGWAKDPAQARAHGYTLDGFFGRIRKWFRGPEA